MSDNAQSLDGTKRMHDRIRDALAAELNRYDGFDATTERWVETPDGERTRVDVLLERNQWDGLKQDTVKYGFEVKRQTGSVNHLHRQVRQYAEAGVIPIPTLPHPSVARESPDGSYGLLEQAESNAFTAGPSGERPTPESVVYYDNRVAFRWWVYKPHQSGLKSVDWETLDNRLYDPSVNPEADQ
jgi:hypothetical protein